MAFTEPILVVIMERLHQGTQGRGEKSALTVGHTRPAALQNVNQKFQNVLPPLLFFRETEIQFNFEFCANRVLYPHKGCVHLLLDLG